MAEKIQIAGKNSNIIGESGSNLILKGQGLKFQFGNKFIDIVKNGKVVSSNDIVLKTANSVDDIIHNGIYLIGENEIWVNIGGNKIKLSNSDTSYVSFLTQEKEATAEEKYTALTNIGFYYDTLQQLENANINSGIVYIKETNDLYIIKEGVINKYTPAPQTVEESSISQEKEQSETNEYIVFEDNYIKILKDLIITPGITLKSSDEKFKISYDNSETVLTVALILF